MSPSEERGRLDQDREDRNPFDYRAPSSREGHSVRTDFSREDAPERFARVQQSRRGGALGSLFRTALVAAGGIAAYKLLHKTPIGIEIANQLAIGGRHVRRGWNKIAANIVESAASTSPEARALLSDMRETGQSALGRVGKIDRLKETLKQVEARSRAGDKILHTDIGGALRDSFNVTHQAPAGYSMITAGDVLGSKSVRGLVGRNQQAILQQGIESGLISAQTQLGRGLMRTGTGALTEGSLRTTAPFLAKNLGAAVVKGMDWLRIPVIDWKLSSIVRKPMAILAPHKGMLKIGSGTPIGGTGKATRFPGSYLIDGQLFAARPDGGYTKVAEGLRYIARSEHKDLMRVGGAMYGDIADPEFSRGIMGFIERKTGIGRAYATDRSILSALFLDPIKRLSRGQLELKDQIRRSAAQRAPQEKALDYFLESGGYVGKEYGKVKNIYSSVDDLGSAHGFVDKVKAAYGKGKYTQYASKGNKVIGIDPANPGAGFPGREGFLLQDQHKWHMMANWMSMRPADLMSWTTGMAWKPGRGLHGWMKNAARMYGAYYGAQMGVEAGRYLDYQIEDLTGFSPIKGAAGAYVGLRIMQKNAADILGVTAAANYAEDLMPISMTSTGSAMARTVLPGLIGGTVAGKGGLAAGLALTGLLGGPAALLYPEDILKSAEEYKEEISGVRNVPVRANRWWEFNTEEFSGGKIKYFKPHWYKELASDYKYTDVAYGSEKNYWQKVSGLPTPSNWFGLRSYGDPGWMGEVHAQDRPYPYIPGSAINAGSRAALLGGAAGQGNNLGNPDDVSSRFNRLFESGTEFLGLYKFLGESILGIQAPFKRTSELESSAEMTSFHNQFWEGDYGGLLGLTEMLRRFVLPRNALADGYNPLPNLMPTWLPGDKSVFDSDQRYFLNFHRGDPYRAIPHGEYRMPGPGYEALHRMHSGTPGVYDAFDRYQILADIAPHSQSFRHYSAIVRGWQKAGVLDESWTRKYEVTEAEVLAKKAGGRYHPRKFTGHDKTIQSMNESIKYSGFEKAVGATWEMVTHDVMPTVPYFGSKFMKAQTPFEAYKAEQVYGETYSNWATPYQSFVAPHLRKAIAEDPLTGAGMGATMGYFGANPLAKAIIGVSGAIIGGGGSAIRAAATGKMRGGWVPEYKQTEWQHMEYMDRLEYVRAKRLQGIAAMEGDAAGARRWKNAAERTMTGLPANASIGQMQAAMPSHLKKYFRGLIGAAPENRGNIIGMLPQHIRPAFSRMWGTGTSDASPEQVASDYFSSHELPEDSWVGWHPNVPFNVSKIKMVDNAFGDMSPGRLQHYGLWEQELSDYHMIYNEMEAPSMELLSPLRAGSDRALSLRRELEVIGRFSNVSSTPRLGFGNTNLTTNFDMVGDLQRFTSDFLRRR